MISLFKRYTGISILYRMLGAFILGGALGILAYYLESRGILSSRDWIATWLSPFGLVLVKMLKMVVIPLIFFSLFQGASSLPLKQFGRIGFKVIVLYAVTSLLAAILGTGFALLLNPGAGANSLKELGIAVAATNEVAQAPRQTMADLLMSLFDNPFQALSSGNFLPIIVFAILAGLALRMVLDRSTPEEQSQHEGILKVTATINQILFVIVEWIMEYAPIGILALTIGNFATYGPDLFGPYFKIATGVIVGILFMTTVVYAGLIYLLTRKSPMAFFTAAQGPMITAFVTRSSGATLPISLRCAIEKMHIRKELAEFSLPLGATINMDGVCIHLPMFAILAANLFGISLSFFDLVTLVFTTVLAAIGAGGIPGGSLMLLFIILNNLGLSSVQISQIVAFALGINPLLDMFETMNNVTGDLTCTYIVAQQEGMVTEPVPTPID